LSDKDEDQSEEEPQQKMLKVGSST